MKILHIIRDPRDPLPLGVVKASGQESEVSILLLQDGVLAQVSGERVYACAEDVRARGVFPPYQTVDYEGIVDLICTHDRVICW